MAELTSKTQAGGAIGDTYKGLKIIRVIADTEYVWTKDNFIDEEVVEIKDVADETARLAETDIEVGDQRRQLDDGNIYELTALPASTATNWIRLGGVDVPTVVADQAARTTLEGNLVAGDEGQLIYQADTNDVYKWNGSASILMDHMILQSWTATEDVQANEIRLIGGLIFTSNTTRTTGGTLDAAELANWTSRNKFGDVSTAVGGGLPPVLNINGITRTDSSAAAFNLSFNAGANSTEAAASFIVVEDSTNTVTFTSGGTVTGETTIPAGTAAGTVYMAVITDLTAGDWTVQKLGGATVIDGLDDVDTTTITPQDGWGLTWDNANSAWRPTELQRSGDIIDSDLSIGGGINASTVERTQTFTTDLGGNVQTLGLGVTSDTASDIATATIYQGVGTGGTVMGTLTATFAGTEVPATLTAFNATSGTIELDPNTQYTIGLVRTTGTGLVGWARNNFDALPGEVSDQGADDYIFRLTTLIQSAEGNDRVFADDTTVSPATAGSPTIAEINAFNAGGNLNSLVYYTGTDTVTDTPTHVYDVDASGIVTVLEEPDNDVPILYGTTDPVNGVTTAVAVDQLYLNKDSREIFRALTLNTWQSVTNRILTPNADTALTADMNNAILQRTNTSGTAAFTINDVFPRGGVATFIQRAPELTTFVAGAGVTIFHPDGHTGMRAQYSVATITRGTVAGEYFLMGDTA